MLARIAMIAMTTSNSMSVKAWDASDVFRVRCSVFRIARRAFDTFEPRLSRVEPFRLCHFITFLLCRSNISAFFASFLRYDQENLAMAGVCRHPGRLFPLPE